MKWCIIQLLHLAKVCDKYNEVLDGIHENDFVKEMEQRDKAS